MVAAESLSDKVERLAAEAEARTAIIAELAARFAELADAEKQIKAAFRSLTKSIVRSPHRRGGRPHRRSRHRATSGRCRPRSACCPAVHGSGLFQRGETQVLNVTTLGMPRMEQMLDTLGVVDRKRYMHHYNFPPYSTGETGFMRGPKRREIGHGMLAERALVPVLPSKEEFAYTIRTVSDVLSSNGSTSMGSVCGSTLSMMDAGVPIKAPVAGIAMGLVFAEGKYTTLTDILGAEDAFGDMDFKVAGTSEFVTALQLDTKIDGIPADVLAKALQQAKEARLTILEVMNEAIAEPRDEVGPTAPKIVSFEIPIDKIGEVIGPKGKVINAIQQETGADISVDDDGTVGPGQHRLDRLGCGGRRPSARSSSSSTRPTADVGQTYTGKVVNITKFGAFVNILPGRDGLLHISKLGGGKRIDRVEDVRRPGRRDRGRGRRRRPQRQGVARPLAGVDAGAARRPPARTVGPRRAATVATVVTASVTTAASRRRRRGRPRVRLVRGRLRRRGPLRVRRPRPRGPGRRPRW